MTCQLLTVIIIITSVL